MRNFTWVVIFLSFCFVLFNGISAEPIDPVISGTIGQRFEVNNTLDIQFYALNILFCMGQRHGTSMVPICYTDTSLSSWVGTTSNDTTWNGFILHFWMKDSSDSFKTSLIHRKSTSGWDKITKKFLCPDGKKRHIWVSSFANILDEDSSTLSPATGDSFFVSIRNIDSTFKAYVTRTGSSSSFNYYYDSTFSTKPGATTSWYVVLIDTLSDPRIVQNPKDKILRPREPYLGQNNPNPFNASTEIEYELPKETIIKMEITDLIGRRVKLLFEGFKHAGSYKILWDSTDDNHIDVPSGVYFYKLTVSGDFADKKKMTLIR